MGIPGTVTHPRSRRRSLVRGMSGMLVGGLVALALVLLAGWCYADRVGLPGPGAGMLVGHLVAAAAAVAVQVWVDRRTDRVGTLAALALSGVLVGGLTLVWLF